MPTRVGARLLLLPLLLAAPGNLRVAAAAQPRRGLHQEAPPPPAEAAPEAMPAGVNVLGNKIISSSAPLRGCF